MKIKTTEEIMTGCEHDGSLIPVSEVKRLMLAYHAQFEQKDEPKTYTVDGVEYVKKPAYNLDLSCFDCAMNDIDCGETGGRICIKEDIIFELKTQEPLHPAYIIPNLRHPAPLRVELY